MLPAASLPTIIIFERHWDLPPKQVVNEILPVLAAEGYDTVCVEAPSVLTQEEIISRSQRNMENVSGIFTQATERLTRAHAMPAGKLEDLGLESLAELMRYYVSSQRFIEVAEQIKQLPAAKLFRQILSTASDLSMSLKGVDVEDKIYATVTRGDPDERAAAIDAVEELRVESFVENLSQVRKVRKGAVFISGATHISKLMAKFKERREEGEYLCFFAHSSKFYGDTLNDLEGLKETYPELKECSTCLETAEDVRLFAQKILAEVKKRQ